MKEPLSSSSAIVLCRITSTRLSTGSNQWTLQCFCPPGGGSTTAQRGVCRHRHVVGRVNVFVTPQGPEEPGRRKPHSTCTRAKVPAETQVFDNTSCVLSSTASIAGTEQVCCTFILFSSSSRLFCSSIRKRKTHWFRRGRGRRMMMMRSHSPPLLVLPYRCTTSPGGFTLHSKIKTNKKNK